MRIYIYIFFLLCSLSSSAFSYPIATDKMEKPLFALPFASWLTESEAAIGITKASDPTLQKDYTSLSKGFSLKQKGAGWLRLELKKNSTTSSLLSQNSLGDLFLKVGDLPAGVSSIYYQDNLDPTKTPGIWFATALHAFESRQLPEPPLSGNTIYIHFEETPGLWFSPVLEKNTESPFIFPSNLILTGLLLCGIIVCLLRALKDKVLWPLWASILLGLGLIQVAFPLPILTKQLELKDLPPLMAPGLCLIVFPHLARLMLRTKKSSPAQDFFLKVLPLFGVVMSLLPLHPEYNWITRLYPLWALLLLPILPISLGALSSKKQGALIFTGACLLPTLGSLWALGSLFMEEIHPLAEDGGLWGFAIGGIFLFLAGIPKESSNDIKEIKEEEKKEDSTSVVPVEEALADFNDTTLAAAPASLFTFEEAFPENKKFEENKPPLLPKEISRNNSENIEKESTKDNTVKEKDPSSHLSVGETGREDGDSINLAKDSSHNISSATKDIGVTSSAKIFGGMSALFHEDEPQTSTSQEERNISQDEYTSETLDLNNSNNLGSSKEITQTEHSSTHTSFADDLNQSLASLNKKEAEEEENKKIISLESDDFSDFEWERQASLMQTSVSVGESYIFSLHTLVRDIHSIAIPLAEDKDILLSWFISPSLPSFLKGDVVSLRQALSLLVQNAVQATNKGAVQLFIRHDPASATADLGSLQFTICDTGVAQRADSGFFHAWELAQRTGGCFSIEYSVSGGTLIIFSAKFELPSDDLLQQHLSSLPKESPELTLAKTHSSYSKEFPLTQQILKKLDIHSPEAILESPIDTNLEENVDPSVPLFIITDMTISNKRLLSHYISSIPHSEIESKKIIDVIEIAQKMHPALIIYDADSPEDMITSSIHAVINWRKQQGLPDIPQLVIVGHEEQAKRMEKLGATKVLVKPFSQKAILEVLSEISLLDKKSSIVYEENTDNLYQDEAYLYKEDSQEIAKVKSSLITEDISTEKTAVETTSFSPFDFDTSTEAHVAPLLTSLKEEDVLPKIAVSNEQQSTKDVELKEVPEETSPNKKETNTALLKENTKVASTEKSENETNPIPIQSDLKPTKGSQEPSVVIDTEKKNSPNVDRAIKTKEQKEVASSEQNSEKDSDVPNINQEETANNEEVLETESSQIEEKEITDSSTSRLEEVGDILFGPAPTGTYPLPRMDGETIEIVLLPLLPGLLNTLKDALSDSIKARQEHQTLFVQEAVSRLANKAEVFGLERLGKIGRCVERAAEADDFEAVDTLLDDLITVTERYIESLKECYDSFLAESR